MRILAGTIVSIVVGFVVLQGFMLGMARWNAQLLINESKPFQAPKENARVRILVAGDSTAVGTGTSDPRYSTAGRLYREFDDTSLVNVAEDGAKIADVLAQFASADGHFDILLLQVGANDILFLTPQEEARSSLDRVFVEATQIADTVIYTSSGNAGASPLFIPPVTQLFTQRSRAMLSMYEKQAQIYDALFVNIFYPRDEDPFLKHPRRFYAHDLAHLSDEGYGLWYEHIRKVAGGVIARLAE